MTTSNGVVPTEEADRLWLAGLSDPQLREIIEQRMGESENAHGQTLSDLSNAQLIEHEPLRRALEEGWNRPALYGDDEQGDES